MLRLLLGFLQVAGAFVGVSALGRYGVSLEAAGVGALCLLPLVLSRLLFYRNPLWGFEEKR